jgi:hypothetical protein
VTIEYRKAGVLLADNRVELVDGVDGFASAAERGAYGSGGVVLDNWDASLSVQGWETWTVDDTDATPTRVYTGFITEQKMGRGGKFFNDSQGVINCDLYDQNVLLKLLVNRPIDNDAKRPAESDVARVAWLLGSRALAGIVTDEGLVSTLNPTNFLEADCRDTWAINVLTEMAPPAAKNFFVYRDGSSGNPALFHDRDDATVWPAGFAISNVDADVDDDTVFAPDPDTAEVDRSPEDQYSGVDYGYIGGNRVYVESAAIAAAMGLKRDAVYDTPRVGRLATALVTAADWLNVRSGEADIVHVTLILRSSHVNKAYAGQEIDVKLTSAEGYGDYVTGRIRRRDPRPVAPGVWKVAYEIWIPPTPVADAAAPECPGIRQVTFTPLTDTTVTFDVATVAGNLMLAWITSRSANFDSHFQDGWTILGPVVVAIDVPDPSDGRWVYVEATGATSYDFTGAPIASMCVIWELDFPYASFVPGDVTLYETTDHAASTSLNLGSVTDPADGQVILYGSVYDTGFDPDNPATAGSGWVIDGNGAWSDGFADQNPWFLGMHWDGTTIPLTGNATVPAAFPYGGVMLQFGQGCGDTPLPATGADIVGETPATQPDGTADDFTADHPYIDGTLHVYLDGIRLLAGDVTETDPEAGDYSLAFAPFDDETVELDYTSR